MGNFGKTVSVFALTLTGGVSCLGLSACSSSAWLVDPNKDDNHSTPPEETAGLPIDAGVSVPVKLSGLITAPTPPPAISGGTLAVSAQGDVAVAADSDRDLIYVVGLADQSVQTVNLTKGSEPGRVVLDNAGCAHVALRSKGAVVRVDLKTATVVTETAACQLPRGLAFDQSSNELLVACASGELIALDATTHVEHSRVFIDFDLRDVVIGKNGQHFVSRYRSAELLQLDANGKVIGQSAPISTTTTRFDNDSSQGIKQGSVSPLPAGFGRTVRSSATLAWRTISAGDGTTVMLHQQSQDDEVIISENGGYGGQGTCQPITQGGITRYGSDGKPTHPILLGGSALVVDIAASADGQWLALAKPGAFLRGEQASLEVISTQATSTDTSIEDGGVLPMFLDASVAVEEDGGTELPSDAGASEPAPNTGIALDAGSPFPGSFFPSSPCVTGWSQGFDVQTTAVVFDAVGNLYAFSREPAQIAVYTTTITASDPSELGFATFPSFVVSQTISLNSASMRDTGHELFHADVGTGLACASCHGEALDDGHIWNFRDFGPRRTQNMRGGLLQTLPLHWEGDLDTFQNLVDEVMTRRMGGFQVEPKYGSALANWIDKQPAIRVNALDATAAARGKVLFESADTQCVTCHTGATLTDNQTVDVGTGGAFQVPSLRGVVLHAPYMHDGCAVTLEDRFDPACGGGDRHGKTSQLDHAQVEDLVAYLQTL